MNINFGCGGNILDGWINHDMDCDITKPLPYDNDSTSMILAEHVCEHTTGPQFLGFLDEAYRILKPAGEIRICMPVLNKLSREARRDIIVNHGHLASYTPELISMFLQVAGFREVQPAIFNPRMDGHWREIGTEKDAIETSRWKGIK